MGAELLGGLANLAWSASGAILVVLMVRRPVRRWCGATLAYQGWLIVPAAMLATLVPSLPSHQQPLTATVLHLATYTGPVLARGGVEWANWALLAWAAGALVVGIRFWREHVRFVRKLGRLTGRDGVFYSESRDSGPAVIGLRRPRVIVPSDFAQRYTPGEQALIIAHERVHVRRGDALVNSVQAMLQCAFWFNPIVHVAASRFRFDQELACDAAVMRQHAHLRRSYADALLKTQTAFTATPSTMTCHWQSSHPLKERIMNLNQSNPLPARRFAGRMLIAALVCASSYAALTARADTAPAADAKSYIIKMAITTPAGKSAPGLLVRAAEQFKVVIGDKEGKLTAAFVLTPVGTDAVKLDGAVGCGNATTAHTVLITRLGDSATVTMQEPGAPGCELAMVVSEVKTKAPAK